MNECKVKRLKSLSCPQLMVSSENENESSTMISKTATFQEHLLKSEHQSIVTEKMFLDSWTNIPNQNETKADVML